MKKQQTGKSPVFIVLVLICAAIAVLPLFLIPDSEFRGADNAAQEAVSELNPSYKTWAKPLMEPPGAETESLLFSLQAAIGAGILGYGFGVYRERTRKEREKQDAD